MSEYFITVRLSDSIDKNPDYWRNFIDWRFENIISNIYISIDETLALDYNAKIMPITQLKASDPYRWKVIFNSEEDLVFFKLKWS